MKGYPVNSKVLNDSLVIRINAENYIQVLSNSPQACLKVMGRLSTRLHWLLNEIDRLSLHNASYQLISHLLEDVPQDSTDKVEIKLGAPKRVIASRISITPETFSRTLKNLSKDGLIEVLDETIVLNNPSELRALLFI